MPKKWTDVQGHVFNPRHKTLLGGGTRHETLQQNNIVGNEKQIPVISIASNSIQFPRGSVGSNLYGTCAIADTPTCIIVDTLNIHAYDN